MSEILVSNAGGLLELRMNRPEKKNALTQAMYAELAQRLVEANADPDTKAVLVASNGQTFCAGNDIGDFMSHGVSANSSVMKFLEALATFEKPIVASVQGPAIGVGATMLLHCDLVYASEAAKLRMPFVGLGLVPEAASSLLLPARVGLAVASEIVLLGAWIDAPRAAELRLVNAVVPAAELDTVARARATELTKLPPNALRTARKLLRGDPTAIQERMREEGEHFMKAVASAEAREAFQAFFEKREPDFSKL